jgi:hypothetical protein
LDATEKRKISCPCQESEEPIEDDEHRGLWILSTASILFSGTVSHYTIAQNLDIWTSYISWICLELSWPWMLLCAEFLTCTHRPVQDIHFTIWK